MMFSGNPQKVFVVSIRSILSALALVAILGAASGCGVSGDNPMDAMHRAVVKARNIFQNVVEKFDEQKDIVQKELEAGKNSLLTFKDAIQTAEDKDAQFASVHKKWNRVEAQMKELRDRFQNLETGADSFYAELENRAGVITDEQEKNNTLKALRMNREAYVDNLEQTRVRINELLSLNDHVQSTMASLEIRYSLTIMNEKLAMTFQEIDTMISLISTELADMSKESKELLATKFQ